MAIALKNGRGERNAQKGCRRPVARCHGIITPPPPKYKRNALEAAVSALWRILAVSLAGGTQFIASALMANGTMGTDAINWPRQSFGTPAAKAAWIDESIATAGETGEWSQDVLYERATGRAAMDGEYVFTPNAPSAGNYVTLKVAATFPVVKGNAGPGADAQAAVKLGQNGFQIWTIGKCCQCENVASSNSQFPIGNSGIGNWQHFHNGNITTWVDVSAHGVTPVAGREYELEFVVDYAARRYSVAVKDDAGAWRRLSDARGRQAFALAAKAERLSSITLDGRTRFRSLKGSHTDAVLSRAETRRRGADADPIGNAAVLASTSQTCLEFRRGQSNSPQTCLEFRRTKSNSPQACPEFRRTKSNCPQGPPEFGGMIRTVRRLHPHQDWLNNLENIKI